MSRPRMPYFSFASTTMERPSGVSSASEASCAASASSCSLTPRRGETGGLAVAERDGAGLVQQQRIDVARGFHRAAGHGHHVEATAGDAGDADGGQQRADGGGIRSRTAPPAPQSRPCPGIRHVARDRRGSKHEDQRQSGQQDVERDLVGRLLSLGTFYQLDHAVQERGARAAVMRTRIQSDSTWVPPVTAERSPPDTLITGAELARDGRLIDRSHAFDHLAIGRNDVASSTSTMSPTFRLVPGTSL